jgi:hypothetical protein
MQTHTTNTTTDTTSTPPTIADYLAMRAEEMRQARERAEAKERADAEARREQKLQTFRERMERGITPGLRAAMRLGEPVYTDCDDEDDGDYFSKVEAPFTYDGATWAIRLWGGSFYLIGPDGEQFTLKDEYSSEKGWNVNTSLLDGLANYPAYLEQKQEQERQRAEQAAREAQEERAAQEERERQPAHYTEPAGSNPRAALLHRGAYVTVWFPSDGEYQAATWGTVESWTKRWLLLTLDTGKQQMIHWRHVATIEPREPRERPTEEPSKATTEAPRYDAEMMSEEIPF